MPVDKHTGEEEGQPEIDFIKAYHKELRHKIDAVWSANKETRQKEMPALGREFLSAIQRGNPATLEVFLSEGMDVNYQDPQTRQTALHVAASAQARSVIRILLATNKCDHLIRDKRGRLASELAYMVGENPALARLLGNKERKQAEKQGVKLTRRPS